MDNCQDILADLRDEVEGAEAFSGDEQTLYRDYQAAYLDCSGHPERLIDVEQLRAGSTPLELAGLAQEIVDSLSFSKPSIDASITEQMLTSTILGEMNGSTDPSQQEVEEAADPVMMFNGQFVHEAEDLRIRGAGLDFVFIRTYKNQVPFNGPLGFHWSHNFHLRLRVAHQTVFLSTGDLREEAFTRHPQFGSGIGDDFDYWIPPDGRDSVLFTSGDSFILRRPNGMRHIFEQDPRRPFLHRLRRIQDRHGNFLQLHYQDGLLRQVEVNHPARQVTFEYDSQRRICLVGDYSGRQWCYSYDSLGDLIAVTSPATARYPAGLTVRYDYSSAFESGPLQHNLLRIIDASGRIYLENEYGREEGLLRFNRVVRQRQGGGEYRFEYEEVPPELEADYPAERRPVHQTILVERNGQPIRHLYNTFGNLLLREQCRHRSGHRHALVEHYRYNRDGKLIASLSPEGVLTQHLYGRDLFIRRHGLTQEGELPAQQLTWRERQAFHRTRATVRRDGYAPFGTFQLSEGLFGDFPEVVDGLFPSLLGERDNDIIVKYTYEPEYGQLRTVSDPRFTLSADPDIPAQQEHPRHFQTLTEYRHDGPSGDPRYLVEIRRPAPTLPDGSPGTPPVESYTNTDGTPAYDPRGRALRYVNAVGSVMVHSYHPDNPADPREGYLRKTVLDPDGLAVTTEYEVDELGRVVATRLPRSAGLSDGRFIAETAYNELDQVIQSTSSLPFGYKTRRFYDPGGRLERIERDLQDENGVPILGGMEVRSYCYDQEFHLVEEAVGGADPSQRLVTRHCYDQAGLRVLTLLPRGNRIRSSYDERLLPVAQTLGAGTEEAATTRIQYDGDGRIRRAIDARGYAHTRSLDAFGRVIAHEDPLGHVTRRNYDKLGNLVLERIFEKRPDGYYLLSRRHTDHDELGRPVRSGASLFQEPPGPVPAGQLSERFRDDPVPGAALIETMTFYDAQGRVARTRDPLQREHSFVHDPLDRLREETDPLGNRTTHHYDAHNNLIRRDREELELDPGNPALVTDRRFFASAFRYDELDRLSSSTDSLGNVTHFHYDSRGNVVRRVDALGNVVRSGFDVFSRRTALHQESTGTGLGSGPLQETASTLFEYDGNHNIVLTTDPLGRQTRNIFDALDRLRTVIYPDGSRYRLNYDADGNLLRTADNNGLQRRYTVDPLGRPTHVAVDASALSGIAVKGATWEHYGYDGADRPILEENDFCRLRSRYDSLGRPIEESITFTSPAPPLAGSFFVRRRFSETDVLTGLTYPSGREVRFERDNLDRIVKIRNLANGSGYPGNPARPDLHDIVTAMQYAGRRPSSCLYANGAEVSYRHDGDGRLIQIRHASAAGPLLTTRYLFDAVGNLRARQDEGIGGTFGDLFFYDSYYRLAHETSQPVPPFNPSALGPAVSPLSDPIPNRQGNLDALIGPLALPPPPRTFRYDPVGNRLQQTNASTLQYQVNQLDQYVQVDDAAAGSSTAYSYDANGNLKDDGSQAYTYDSQNRLVEVSSQGAPVAEFFHDARGRRILEREGGDTRQLIFEGVNLIAEYHNGQLFAQYVHDDAVDRPLQIAAQGTEHWYHADLVGSVRLLTGANGQDAAGYRYTPFGQSLGLLPGGPYNPWRYAGRRLDAGLGTYDFRARQYDPALGRFLQRDPLASAGANQLYAYAGNAPTRFVDPYGTHREEVDFWEEGGGGRVIDVSQWALEQGLRGPAIEINGVVQRPFDRYVQTQRFISQLPTLRDMWEDYNMELAQEQAEVLSEATGLKLEPKFGLPPGTYAWDPWDDFWYGLSASFVQELGEQAAKSEQRYERNDDSIVGAPFWLHAKVFRFLEHHGEDLVLAAVVPGGRSTPRGSVVRLHRRTGVPVAINRPGVGRAYATFDDAFAASNGKRHIMEVIVKDQGKEVARWWEISGKGGQLGHTEQKALARIRLRPGLHIEFRGWYPSCTRNGGCFCTLHEAALRHQVTIEYRSPRWSATFEEGIGHVPRQ